MIIGLICIVESSLCETVFWKGLLLERLFLKGLREIEDPSGWIFGLFEAVSHSKISFVV